nr:1,4-alpha-glucan branching protein GlgB [Spelaeicoccus albus]
MLDAWLPARRWYPGSGTAFSHPAEFRELFDDGDEVAGRLLLIELTWPGGRALLHVPLTFRRHRLADTPDAALLGRVDDLTLGPRWVYDGAVDPAMVRWVAGAITADGDHAGDEEAGVALTGNAAVRPITAEQTNSSAVLGTGPDAVIVKFFRVVAPGPNPDVEIASALAAAGSVDTPACLGAFEIDLPAGEGRATLASAGRYVPGASDGWSLATDAFAEGRGLPGAYDLGVVTARVHRDLATSFGARRAEPDDVRASLLDRVDWARREAGALLDPHAAALDEHRRAIEGLEHVGDVQRVHGDLHLGQFLAADGRWLMLDFEGEPLRPLAARRRPAPALGDVAGMLRSFDYAAGYGALHGHPVDPGLPARAAGEFLAGYSAESGTAIDAGDPLLHALLIDKALYEVVYEERHRPKWLPVPLGALTDLLEEKSMTDRQDDRLDAHEVARLAGGNHHDPHRLLGAHQDDGVVTFRTVKHLASTVTAVTPDDVVPLEHVQDGLWAGSYRPDDGRIPDYRLRVTYPDGTENEVDDPYRFLPTVGEVDRYLIGEGRHETLWEVLGAHVRRYPGVLGDVDGTAFAVWAPSAQSVRVVGAFNDWNGITHPMRSLGASGVWELFIPGVGAGTVYKYEILGSDGTWKQKADPMAQGTEVPPATGSVVTASRYEFADDEWMSARSSRDPHNAPMSTYEVHLGSWRLGLDYRQLAVELVDYVTRLGFTHVEFMPVAEHPFGGSWGYQVTSYYAPTARFGHPDEFRHLVDALHRTGIGVILDWVPAHFPKDDFALAKFDGGPLYEHPDPRRGEQPDWGTLIFDYGRREVRGFLVANALYWMSEFHIDGLRVDAVASMLYLDYSRGEGEWTPNARGGRENLEAIDFLKEVTATCYRLHPGTVMIAEESTAFPGVTAPTDAGGLGFGLKWNMGWMHDTLEYVAQDPMYRSYHHDKLTFSIVYAFSENFVLPISHDEVVHGKGSLLRKMPGDRWKQLAGVRSFLAYQWAHPGKQLIFMGTEFGQEAEWSEEHGLDWWLTDDPRHSGVQRLVADMNAVYSASPALYGQDNSAAGFEWLDGADAERNVVSFVRWSRTGQALVCIANFAGLPYEGYRVALPFGGSWDERLNSDAEAYGGSGVGNDGPIEAVTGTYLGKPAYADIRIPPLGVLYLTPSAS